MVKSILISTPNCNDFFAYMEILLFVRMNNHINFDNTGQQSSDLKFGFSSPIIKIKNKISNISSTSMLINI